MNTEQNIRTKPNLKTAGQKPPRNIVTIYDNKKDIHGTSSKEIPCAKGGKPVLDYSVVVNNEDTSINFPAREIILLFQCVRCKDTPLSPPVHICPAGHQSCHHCYASYNLGCVSCRQSFIGRNEILEMVIQNLHPTTALKLSYLNTGDKPPEDNIEQYDPDLLAKLERAHYESLRTTKLANENSEINTRKTQTETFQFSSEPSSVPSSTPQSSVTVDDPFKTETPSCVDVFRIPPLQSYVPVKCPIQSCGGVVSGNAFINHFEFEHITVPIIAADYNSTNCKIAVNPSAFCDYNVQCLAMFLVPNELPTTPSIVKIVTDSEESIMSQIRLRKRSMLCLVLATKFGYVSPNSCGEPDGQETFFLAWAACLYEKPPIHYTIEATNSTEKLHTIKYCGPIGTLHETQNPGDVFGRGNCLVASPGLLNRLSSPSGNIDISVIFHPVAI